jgi:hypothetical protein
MQNNTEIELNLTTINGVVMAKKEMGQVKTPSGWPPYYYWDDETGDVHVGSEYAGKASSADEAFKVATIYAGKEGYKGQ